MKLEKLVIVLVEGSIVVYCVAVSSESVSNWSNGRKSKTMARRDSRRWLDEHQK